MSSQPTIPVVRRPDLQSATTSVRGQTRHTLKDPIASRFFQLREEEHFILDQLSEPLSWSELGERVNSRFAPQRVSHQQLESFVAVLHREGLVRSAGENQGDVLLSRRQKTARRDMKGRWSNPLAIRFRGVNPSAWIERALPWIGWAASPASLAVSLVFLIVTMLFAMVRWPVIAAELPQLSQWATTDRLLWLAVAMGLSKVFHELGHAVVCHRMGGRCRELGLMLLIFVPCLYCNVSDAWMVRSKWRRIAVSGAGIWVELMVACTGFWVWQLTNPGWVHSLGLSMAVVCSVNTLLFNGNPLLRYDGYYMLADYCEIPNLHQQSRQRLGQLVVSWTTGVRTDLNVLAAAPDRIALPYAILSITYRWVVVAIIWWVLDSALRPWNLEALATCVFALMLAAMTGPWLHRGWNYLKTPRRRGPDMNWFRLSATTLLVAIALVGIMLLPISNNVTAPGVVQGQATTVVRATAKGTLVWAAAAGQMVKNGDVVARLEDLQLQRDLSQAESDWNAARRRIATLNKLGAANTDVESTLVVAEQLEKSVREAFLQLKTDAQQLVIRATRDGRLTPPRNRKAPDRLRWEGNLLDPANRGALVEINDEIGIISEPAIREVVAVVNQKQIALIQPLQEVRVAAHAVTSVISGHVLEISEVDLDHPPPELVEANLVAGGVDSMGEIRATDTIFKVRIAIHDETNLPISSLAHVKIITPRRTIWEQTQRFLAGLGL